MFMLEIIKNTLINLDFDVDEAENGLVAVQMHQEA